MKKINFEDGVKIKDSTVIINDIEYLVSESEYEGDTPLNAATLNLLQENIEEQLKTKQTTQIAEELSISNTAPVNGSLDIKDGKTIQEGTPTPDTPIDIRNVGDNINILKVTNGTLSVNSIDITVTDEKIILNGTATTNTWLTLNPSLASNTPPGQNQYIFSDDEYTFSNVLKGEFTTDTRSGVNLNLNNISNTKYNKFNSSNIYDISKEDGLYNCFIRLYPGDTFNNAELYIKLEKGTTATPYTPYNCGSIDIKVKNEDNTQNKIIQFPLAEGQVLHKGDYLAEDGIHPKNNTYSINGNETIAISQLHTNTTLFRITALTNYLSKSDYIKGFKNKKGILF